MKTLFCKPISLTPAKILQRILLCLFIFTFLAKPSYADKIEDLLKIASNPLNSSEARKKAVLEAKLSTDPRILTTFIDIIKNASEPIAFRAFLVESLLMHSNGNWAVIELTKIAKDSKLPSEVRKPALYGLWIKDPQKFKADVMKIAQNSNEPVELRVTALTYLRTSGDTKLPLSFWNSLIGKNNDAQIRIAALNGMEQLGLLVSEKNSLIQIIENTTENVQLRKTSILNAERALSEEEVTPILIQIMSKPENPIEIRKYALNHLASYSFESSIPALEKILVLEKNPSFRGDLKALIDGVSQH